MRLTPRQTEWASFLRRFIDEKGFAPTRREFADHFGMSPNGAQNAILTLERKGWIRRAPETARGLVVVDTHQLDSLSDLG